MLDNRAVEADDRQWLAGGAQWWAFGHVVPPRVAQVVFQLRAERTEIPKAVLKPP